VTSNNELRDYSFLGCWMRVTGLCVYLDFMNWASGDLALIDELPVSGVVWCGVSL
jgi:hypothetical protein